MCFSSTCGCPQNPKTEPHNSIADADDALGLVWFRFVSFHPVLVRPWPIPRFILFSNIIIIVLAPLYTILLSAHADDLILYYLPAVKSHI